ncbi:HAD family hydrolase [Salipaludibacillus sp. CF4.18]|uniref:HAD family hydrolase n=1 Tax=Salipaludibacillus sp. CF4.18 TaxID=3373081 RepID=UPI003EE569D4
MDTIIFDVDDTLYDQLVPFKIALRKLLKNSVSEQLLHEIYVSSRKHSDALFEKNLSEGISLLDMQTYRISAACQESGINISFQEAVDFQENYLEEQHRITLYKDIELLLDFLNSKNKQIALLTNGDKEHQSMKIKQLGLINWIPKEHHFISNEIGYAKPSEEVFLHIEKKLELEKSKTVYIGDSFENDVVGAKQVGWHSIWMNHRKRAMPDIGIKPDLVFSNTKELLDSFQK